MYLYLSAVCVASVTLHVLSFSRTRETEKAKSTQNKLEVTIMNNSVKIIIRSLIETVIGWILLALILSQIKDITFVQALLMPHTIALMIPAFVGGCIGYRRRALKKQGSI